MKSFLHCLFLFTLSSSVWAQTITWTGTHHIKKIDDPRIGKVLEVQDGNILAIHTYDSGFETMLGGIYNSMHVTSEVLSIWDEDLKPKKHKSISKSYKGNDLQFREVYLVGGKLFAYYTYVNREQKKVYLFAQQFDKKSLEEVGELKVLFQADAKSRIRYGDFSYQISDNHEFLAVYHEDEYSNQDKQASFQVKMFDSNMEAVWEKDVQLDHVNKRTVVTQMLVSDQAACFLMGQEFTEMPGITGSSIFTKNDDYRYWIYGIDGDGKEIGDQDLISENKLAKGVIAFNEVGQVVFISCYSPNKYHSIKGVHAALLDPLSLEVIKKVESPLSQDLLAQFLPKKKLSKDTEVQDFETTLQRAARAQIRKNRFTDFESGTTLLHAARAQTNKNPFTDIGESFTATFIHPKSDGGYYYLVERSEVKGGGENRLPNFHSEEIMIISLNSGLEWEWGQRIPKHQVRNPNLGTTALTGYQPVFVGNQIHLITYLHEKDAANTKLEPESFKCLGQIVQLPSLITISETGKVSHTVLYRPRELDKTYLDLNSIWRIDEKTAIFSAFRKGRTTEGTVKLGKLTLP